MLEFDPFAEAYYDDPFPIYRRLRDEAPDFYLEELDCFFLSRFDATRLPAVVAASAAASLLVLPLSTRLMSRFGPASVMPWAFAASALLLVIEWVLSLAFAPLAAVALYLHMAVFGALLISGFWSVINEHYDPHTAKRLVGRIAAGATEDSVVLPAV